MIMTRSQAVTAAVAAAAALTATGITYAAAAPAPQAVQAAPAPQQAPMGGAAGNDHEEGGHHENKKHGRRHHEHGHIDINERSYSAHTRGCITIVSGLGSRSLNIRNDSHKTVEVFRGATCDNGSPIATVGPHSSSNGVDPGCFRAVRVRDGVVASFRVVDHHHGGKHDNGDHGDF